MSDLEQIVEKIGQLGDSVEISRWELCRAVEEAYSEFPAYQRGLTDGIAHRLKKSADSVYSMRDSWRLREEMERFRGVSEDLGLSSSHWGALYQLRERYDLDNQSVFDWLELASAESLSVRELSMEVSAHCREDERKGIKRILAKIGRLTQRLHEDSESLGLPEALRQTLLVYLSIQIDLFDKLMEWLG